MMATTKRTTATPRRRLGKGLGSLMSSPVKVESPSSDPAASEAVPDTESATNMVTEVPVDSIHRSSVQPRTEFDEQALDALAASIASAGLMQPIVVRRSAAGLELIAGERRWRAAQRAGLETIPAIVRDADDRQAAELSLIENLQREDLNPIERATAFQRLIAEHGLLHQDVGELVGLDRSSVTNHLRLLELDDQVKEMVRMGLLGMAHARALLAISEPDDRVKVAAKAVREGWSVRTLESEARGRSAGKTSSRSDAKSSGEPLRGRRAHLADMERRLSDHLGTRVRIRPAKKKGSGSVVIDFYNGEQFEGLMSRLGFSSNI